MSEAAFEEGTRCSAKFSPCRTWRYKLSRIWGPRNGRVVFIGLNPSTADESEDDPTIRRCIGFAKTWGYGGIYMLNLFAFRATDPRDLKRATDPIGPENDKRLVSAAQRANIVVAAWGVHGTLHNRSENFIENVYPWYLRDNLSCLGHTKNGHPKHPLYLPKTTPLCHFRKGG